ncbi:hypothetical protein CHO01_31600 [Cellulomonas hominis]|uniref:LPXTG-motif cell wall-anchored protein n=1 Tax=Cellulomonas hominis TaxID=156981 RepID=A0A511FHK5_9CELL|nr:LPXTG cell wall anchor domain-containing protein [Cellulomonas hominis]MBB5474780.1 LPXTG-motif cell wall-anchored protein [Cellulomonas hominis]NKY05435.1 LPXTG cell wall anchor domain-containing protein [Cellulomonas hominis]GEL48044.1 hypothetical protein CHO01_31600 [Cellulomonas hominis]
MNSSVNLVGAWTTFWNAINQGSFSRLMTIITVLGVCAVVFAGLGFLWRKRRNNGGDAKGLWWSLGLGAAASAPNFLIPIVLTVLDLVINIIAGFFKSLAG